MFERDRAIGEELAGWGKVIMLRTAGRRTGRPVTTAVGFVEEPDGTLLIAAGDVSAHWARNLAADPRCTATRSGETLRYVAEELHGARRNQAIAALILRYGTPAERLGAGPAFELRPVSEPPPDAGRAGD